MMQRSSAAEWRNFVLGMSVCATASVWGLSVLVAGLQGARAQDATEPAAGDNATTGQPAEANGSTETAGTSAVYRIGFVNLEQVIRAYPRWWKSFEQVQAEAENRRITLEEERNRLNDIRVQLEANPNPSDDLLREYARRVNLLELNARSAEAEIERKVRDLSRSVYNDVYAEIERTAEGAYDVIMGVSEREIRTGSQAEFFQKIPARAV